MCVRQRVRETTKEENENGRKKKSIRENGRKIETEREVEM